MSLLTFMPALLRFGWLLIILIAAISWYSMMRKLKHQEAVNQMVMQKNSYYQTELLRIKKELVILEVELKSNAFKKETVRQQEDKRLQELQQELSQSDCAQQPVPNGIIRLQHENGASRP